MFAINTFIIYTFSLPIPSLGLTRGPKHQFFLPVSSLGLTRLPKQQFLLCCPKLGTDKRSQATTFAFMSQDWDWQEVPSINFWFPVPSLGLQENTNTNFSFPYQAWVWQEVPNTDFYFPVPSLGLTRGPNHKFLLSLPKLWTDKRSQAPNLAFLSQAWDWHGSQSPLIA